MGASNSKMEEDKALQLCRERKKFVRQALDGRCSLASTHLVYIEALRKTGTALKKFVEPEAPIDSSMYTSTNATPEPLQLTEKSPSRFSFSSHSLSQRVETTENFSPTPSPPSSIRYQSNHMKFRGTFSRKVEEKPSVPITVSLTSSTPPDTTPRSSERPESSPFETPVQPGTPPWDYFGLFKPVEHHFASQEGEDRYADDGRHHRESEETFGSDDGREKFSSPGRGESLESEDEFDEPSTETLVRSFENVNRLANDVANGDKPTIPPVQSVESKIKSVNGEERNSPDLSPVHPTSAGVAHATDLKTTPITLASELKATPARENDVESKLPPKDFISSIRDIDYYFSKASESGREVPRMLEANKFHFRPIFPGKEGGSVTSMLMKSCFSCGEDPSQVTEEPPQPSVKYLTWHRTASSRSSSSRNHLGPNSLDDVEDLNNNLFDNFCMISGSHASTLDRLFAWEKKLYDEVKISEMIRREYDAKRKLLRQLESKVENTAKIDKTRAVVKDLHSRIRVAIHRIDSISRKIEELRDTELQPQLEELIEGLKRMWEVMLECHKLQVHIISVAHIPGNIRITLQSDTRRQAAAHLTEELSSLSSSFTKWIDAQKAYVEAINQWLYKCVLLEQKSSRRKRRMAPPLKDYGPPIYAICDVWLNKFNELPKKEVADSARDLAAAISHLLPRQEKTEGKGLSHLHSTSWQDGANGDPGEASDWATSFNNFHTRLAFFLEQLNKFSKSSVILFTEIQKTSQEAKSSYEQSNSQRKV